MSLDVTCPRGHHLDEGAVYCTVCWVRVVPEDPERVEQRKSRQRRLWFPLFGAGALVVGVSVGGALAAMSGAGESSDVIVAGPESAAPEVANDTEPAPAPPEPSAAGEPVTAVVAPLAATIELTTTTLCVPDSTAKVVVRSRTSSETPWEKTPADVALGEQGGCASGEVEAALTFPDAPTDGTSLRVTARDGNGDQVARVELAAPLQ